MKKRIHAIVAAVALLVVVTLPILPASLPGEGGRVHRTGVQSVALLGADLESQSGYACGG